ncbi:hypothetical protein AC249_AIPGENE5105 [Exaiptasia diaphana]|nr:hypothetical protein AC249_AIPGENE5105 [Exaiptasia diaphana]
MGNILEKFKLALDTGSNDLETARLIDIKDQLNDYINEIVKEIKDRDVLIEKLIEENEKLRLDMYEFINHSDAAQDGSRPQEMNKQRYMKPLQ